MAKIEDSSWGLLMVKFWFVWGVQPFCNFRSWRCGEGDEGVSTMVSLFFWNCELIFYKQG